MGLGLTEVIWAYGLLRVLVYVFGYDALTSLLNG
jgi:hypothetical protein